MAHTPWIGETADKLYLQSGQFTSTLRTSQEVGTVDTYPDGITYDSNSNTPWCGREGDKLYLQSGQFTSTLKTSQYIGDVDTYPHDISWDGTDTPWVGDTANKLYLQSGQFSSTIKDSQEVGTVELSPKGISFDGTNTPWCGISDDKLYLQSAQFTSTLITSQYLGSSVANPVGISWDGTNTPWCTITGAELKLQSGQFTSTVKISQEIGGVDTAISGICTNNVSGRLGAILSRSITSTLSLSQDTHITGLPLRVSSNITFTDDFHLTDRPLYITSDITFTDESRVVGLPLHVTHDITFSDLAEQSIYSLSVEHTITFSSTAYRPFTFNRIANNTIIFTDVASYVYEPDIYYPESILEFIDYADTDIKGRPASNTILFNQVVNYDNTIKRPLAENTLFFYSQVIAGGSLRVEAENNATLDYVFFDPITGEPYIIHFGFSHEVSYNHNREPYNDNNIYLSQDLSYQHIKASGISVTAENTITFTVAAITTGFSEHVDSIITFSQTAVADFIITTHNDFEITQSVIFGHDAERALTSTIGIKQAVAYELYDANKTLCEYSIFVGTTTDPDAPQPPPTKGPTRVRQDNIELTYPIDLPTHTVTLRGPEYDNRDKLQYQRVQRESRGGTLTVYADPQWTRVQLMSLFFIGLSEAESQEVLTFVNVSLGKIIGIRDWEGNYWAGVIITPDNSITRDRPGCGNSLALDLEVKRVYRITVSQAILSHQVDVYCICPKSLTSVLSSSQSASAAGSIFNRTSSSTLSPSHGVVVYCVNPRSLTSVWSPSHGVDVYCICPRSLTSILSPSQSASAAGSIFNRTSSSTLLPSQEARSSIISRSLSSTLSLSQEVILWHVEAKDTPWIGSEADKLYLQSGHFSSTLKTSQSITDIDIDPSGITWDETNTPWIGRSGNKLYLQSGQFTSTLKTSQEIGTIETDPTGISWDGIDTPWVGYDGDRLYLQSGQFTSTLRTSQSIVTIDSWSTGISYDGTNTPWIGAGYDKLYLQSAQFTSTLITSQEIGTIETNPSGISWNGVDTPWTGYTDDKLYLQSGHFTSTLKTSQGIGNVDDYPMDICTNNYIGRLGI